MNKYTKWYNQITDRARGRIIDDYTESHHIIPESLGGPDTAENLVDLTAREHFICHWLLVMMTTGEDHWKMVNALRMMKAEKLGQKRYHTKITARVYENLKKEYSILQSERKRGENNPMYGDKFYRSEEGKQRQREAILGDNNGSKKQEARMKIAESKLGKKRAPFSEEWRARLSESKRGEKNNRYGVELSEETRRKIGDRIRGRKQTAEEKQRRAEANKGRVKPKRLCPHCNQMIAVNTYPRWHGVNCKTLKGIE